MDMTSVKRKKIQAKEKEVRQKKNIAKTNSKTNEQYTGMLKREIFIKINYIKIPRFVLTAMIFCVMLTAC